MVLAGLTCVVVRQR